MPSAPAPASPSDPSGWLRLRRAGNLLNGSTALGLLAVRLGGARRRPGPRGLILAEGYRLGFPRAGAFTVGNVVLTASDFEVLRRRNPELLDHEDAHAWQWFYCAGLPFLPLYGLACAWSWLRRGDVWSGNFFERGAGLVRGDYVEAPVSNAGFRRLGRRVQTLIEKPSRLAERSF